jgi:hypothetical protein
MAQKANLTLVDDEYEADRLDRGATGKMHTRLGQIWSIFFDHPTWFWPLSINKAYRLRQAI